MTVKASVKSRIKGFLSKADGATAIEYTLIVAGISLAIATAVFAFGESLSGLYDGFVVRMAEAMGRGG